MTSFPLWFNRDVKSPIAPGDLSPFTEGRHFLSTKQVPSALILACAGSQTVSANRDVLLRAGFTIREETRGEGAYSRDLTMRRTMGDNPMSGESVSSFIIDSTDAMDLVAYGAEDIDDQSSTSGDEGSDHGAILDEKTIRGTVRMRRSLHRRIRYEDPWKIHAGYILATSLGKTSPEIVTWSGDGIRLQDPLPSRLLGDKWDGSRKNFIKFHEIADHQVKLDLLYRHTHWGKALANMCNGEAGNDVTVWAMTLRRRINRLLSGGTDPLWTMRQRTALLADPDQRQDPRARALRLIELLKTVDGIFLQRYVAYPEEVWTWDRFDMFTLGNLSLLIGDEFLDGEVTQAALHVATSYSLLKACRKWFKGASHGGNLEQALQELPEGNPWCRQFVNVWKRTTNCEGPRLVYLKAMLSQTRGCGTPPPLVLLQSKDKFLRTIGLQPPEPTKTQLSLLRMGLDEVLNHLPDQAFTGLSTKSRVTVTSSACWERTRKEGGTTEQIRRILQTVAAGERIPVRNLDTGQIETYRDADDFNSVGEQIFWTCLDHVLRTPPDDLKVAFLTVVKEPGKARSVTKARACLKIVLDTVSKICSEPLAKGVRSSSSGMSAANHGWNFFLELMSSEAKEEAFSLLSREENPYEGYTESVDTFDDLFILSTDYKEATDSLKLYVARILGDAWMRKCGIPALLRGIVMKTCYEPRTVLFRALGPLRTMGDSRPEFGPDIRAVTLRQGVLMGDPLTKPVLHLTNVVTRHLGTRMLQPDFYGRLPNGNSIWKAVRDALQLVKSGA